jgi:CRISPR-associated endonuclease Cas1
MRSSASSSGPQPSEILPGHGVITLFGYKIQVRVDRGHLLLEDGIGSDRRATRLPRVGHGLKRLVTIGSDGMISLAALRWLSDQKAAFIMLDREGHVLATTGPVRPSDARLRRAQAIASQSGAALRIARVLIDKKIWGQENVARRKLLAVESANTIARFRADLANADTAEAIRLIESQAASAYWAAWRTLPINFPRKDESLVPRHWRFFGARVSPLTGSPRLAANPPNAILNYLYALLESESRLAAAALGLDPGMGMLHVDMANRDSLACDLMEPVRPQVDAFLLDWITREPLKREWLFEERSGNCRLMASLAMRLSETAATWGRAVAPFAEWVAQTLWNSNRKPARGEQMLPTRLTQRRKSEGRGNDFIPRAAPVPSPARICHGCGGTVRKGHHCASCATLVSREKLIEFAHAGRVAAQGSQAQKRRSATQRRHAAEIQVWLPSSNPSWLTETVYVTKIQPRLAVISVPALSSALSISAPYAADIRAGRRRPHPRHWQVLAQLVHVSSVS